LVIDGHLRLLGLPVIGEHAAQVHGGNAVLGKCRCSDQENQSGYQSFQQYFHKSNKTEFLRPDPFKSRPRREPTRANAFSFTEKQVERRIPRTCSAGVLAGEFRHRPGARNNCRPNRASMSGGETPPTLAAETVALPFALEP